MDNFGFPTQGINYGKFRPIYPQCLYNYTIDKIKSRNRYLDVAMGTGQLLFNIGKLFNYSLGIDISNKMLQTSINILKNKYQHLQQKIRIQKCCIMDLKSENKFDLITVGQALHWFPIRDSLYKMKQYLSLQGRLLILSYYVKGCQSKQQQQLYSQFYMKVKPFFDFDRDQLQNKYMDNKKYVFEQIFPQVIRYSQQVKISMSKQTYVNYLKTYSGYNQYIEKNKDKEDPIKKIQEKSGQNVVVLFEYFKIECGLRQK